MKTLLFTATVAAVILFATASSWGQETILEGGKKGKGKSPEPKKATPDLTVGDDKGKAAPPPKPEAEAEAKAKAEAEDAAKKREAELQKQVEDLQKRLEAAEKAAKEAAEKAAKKPALEKAPAKAPAKKRVAKKPAAKKAAVARALRPRVQITRVTDKNDPQAREAIRALRIQLARLEGRQEGAAEREVVRQYVHVRVFENGQVTGGSATANGKAKAEPGTATKNGFSKTEEPKEKPSMKNGEKDQPKAEPKKSQPKADEPKPDAPKDGAEGKGKAAAPSSEQSLGQPRGVPVRFLIPKGMGRLGG